MELIHIAHFGAGPSRFPPNVLKQLAISIHPQLLNYIPLDHVKDAYPTWFKNAKESIHDSDKDDLPMYLSIAELSHRSYRYEAINDDTNSRLKRLLSVPDDYVILFLQGGASLQFSQIILNIVQGNQSIPLSSVHADYFVTGIWSEQAYEDAKKMKLQAHLVLGDHSYKRDNLNACKDEHNQQFISSPSQWKFNPESKFIYFCDNETVQGVLFSDEYTQTILKHIKSSPSHPILVCDMSSSILSKPIQVSDYDIIFASAQKNLGMSGVSIVIVKKSLLPSSNNTLPFMMDYLIHSNANSIYNTPPTVAIYTINLVLRDMASRFGTNLKQVDEWHKKLSDIIYDVIDSSNGFYIGSVSLKFRSKVNIVFRLRSTSLEKTFLSESMHLGMIELKGHRSTGGIRVSLYNHANENDVIELATFMKKFASK